MQICALLVGILVAASSGHPSHRRAEGRRSHSHRKRVKEKAVASPSPSDPTPSPPSSPAVQEDFERTFGVSAKDTAPGARAHRG